MGERDIDKYFRDELKGYSKEVDTDAIWSALDLDKKRKNRPFLMWLIGLVIITILASVYFVFDSNNTDENIGQLTKVTSVFQNESEKLFSNPENSFINPSNENLEKKSSPDPIQKSYTKEINLETSTQSSIDGLEERLTQNRIDVKPFFTLKPNGAILNGENQETNLSQSNANVKQELVRTETESKEKYQFTDLIDDHIQLPSRNTASEFVVINSLDVKNAKPFKIIDRAKPDPYPFATDLLNNNLSKGLSLNIYSGIFNVDRTLTTQNIDLEQFLLRKEESESPLELISVGIQLRYDIGAVYFKGGIEFQSLNEKFEYEQYSIIDTVPTAGVVGILIDHNGNSMNQLGTVFEENTLTSNWTHYNSYRLFNIPLSIGYEKGINKWFFSIEAQSQLNFHHSFSGKRLNQEGNITDDNVSINKSFKLGLGAAIGLRYRFSNTTSIYLNPSYLSYLDSFADETKGYSEKYSLFGLQVGLSYKLF